MYYDKKRSDYEQRVGPLGCNVNKYVYFANVTWFLVTYVYVHTNTNVHRKVKKLNVFKKS